MNQLQRCIHKGMLFKRCRLSWRPRYVEMVLDPGSQMAGRVYAHQLVLYDQHHHMIKNTISFGDIVTVRSCRDCIFQVFISNGKILQFRSESIESQAHWMAALKIGLGKGCIFHVRVHTSAGLDHALLYSIGVNLPAHRVGQLDRVLVLASPINDINLNAWDLNRVKGFVESDVGIRMDLCPSCIRGGQSDRVTFIMEKKFINDCILFLLREAKIEDRPRLESGLKIYKVPHQCGHIKQPNTPAPPLPPPYTEDDTQVTAVQPEASYENFFHSPSIGPIVPAYPLKFWDESPQSESGGSLSRDFASLQTADNTKEDFRLFLPPRTIPRLNYESSIPAIAHPYIKFQPHMYHQSRRHFEAPYQISSRIIITDSGDVQFERNIMGNTQPQEERGLLFKKDLPVPPKGLRANFGQLQSNSRGRLASRVDKEEVQPSLHGARFLETARKDKTPAPPPPEVLSLVNTVSNGTFGSDEGPPTPSPAPSHLFTTATSRLVASTSDVGLATKATNHSIATLFPRTGPTPPRPLYFSRQSVKRTSSDSELSTLSSRAETTQCRRRSLCGHRTVAGLKCAASMKRASEVSDTSDIYIIPTSSSSTTSFRESMSENPISPSYVRESDFLRDRLTSPLTDDDDCAFLPEEKEHDYVNQHHYMNGVFIKEKLARQSSADGFQNIRKNKPLVPSVSLPIDTTADYRNMSASSYNSTAEDKTTTVPNRSHQQKKPLPRPRKNTLSLSSSDNNPEENDSKFNDTAQDESTAISSTQLIEPPLTPRRVTFSPEKEETVRISEHLSVSTLPQYKSRSLPRKPPVPKPRTLLTTHATTNLPNVSYLSTSDSDLRGSLELDDNPYISNRSTHTVIYNGIAVGVTDL